MYVLMHKKTCVTGRMIAQGLGLKSRFKTPMLSDTVAFRWGTAEHIQLPSALQDAEAIARAGNKIVAFQCFKRDGVPCPEIQVRPATTSDGVWFGRSAHGMGGTDIVVYQSGLGNDAGDRNRHEFYSKFIPNTREYRIHVFKGEILGVMGKYLDFPDQAKGGFVKNVAHGYRFRTPSKQLRSDRLDAARDAVESLGLDFGAVDLIVGDDGKAYVLEVNTAPGLATMTLSRYVEAFKKALSL